MHRRTFLQGAALAAMSLALPAQESLKVGTFNVLFQDPQNVGPYAWAARRQRVIDWILESRCDLLGLQEVLPPQRVDLDAGLSEVYGSVGRPVKTDGTLHTNLVLYRREAFRLEESRTVWLSDEPQRPGSRALRGKEPDEPRTATLARVRGRQGALWFVNTHWDPRDPELRASMADVLLAQLPPEGPLIVLGDFNADEGEPAQQAMRKAFLDSWRDRHPEGPAAITCHHFNAPFPQRHIDYIFTRGFTVDSCDVIASDGDYLSDHYPVVAKLTVKRAP